MSPARKSWIDVAASERAVDVLDDGEVGLDPIGGLVAHGSHSLVTVDDTAILHRRAARSHRPIGPSSEPAAIWTAGLGHICRSREQR
jgi:hypothetical protein